METRKVANGYVYYLIRISIRIEVVSFFVLNKLNMKEITFNNISTTNFINIPPFEKVLFATKTPEKQARFLISKTIFYIKKF